MTERFERPEHVESEMKSEQCAIFRLSKGRKVSFYTAGLGMFRLSTIILNGKSSSMNNLNDTLTACRLANNGCLSCGHIRRKRSPGPRSGSNARECQFNTVTGTQKCKDKYGITLETRK